MAAIAKKLGITNKERLDNIIQLSVARQEEEVERETAARAKRREQFLAGKSKSKFRG